MPAACGESSQTPGSVRLHGAATIVIGNATGQPQTTGFGQRGITVNHEDLRSELVRSWTAHTSLGGLRLVTSPRRHQRQWSIQLRCRRDPSRVVPTVSTAPWGLAGCDTDPLTPALSTRRAVRPNFGTRWSAGLRPRHHLAAKALCRVSRDRAGCCSSLRFWTPKRYIRDASSASALPRSRV